MKKGDLRFVALMMGSVIGAGFLMKMFSDAPVLGDARDGFTG